MTPGGCGRQVIDLRHKFPDATTRWKQGRLTWTGPLQPTPLSDTYTVAITWPGRGRPKVSVLDPALEAPGGRRVPHVFSPLELCLHFPEEWHDSMLISDTIIPWASEWLYFYELWLATGDWHGGGHEPDYKPPSAETTVDRRDGQVRLPKRRSA
jgi:hypothetical protein